MSIKTYSEFKDSLNEGSVSLNERGHIYPKVGTKVSLDGFPDVTIGREMPKADGEWVLKYEARNYGSRWKYYETYYMPGSSYGARQGTGVNPVNKRDVMKVIQDAISTGTVCNAMSGKYTEVVEIIPGPDKAPEKTGTGWKF